MSNLVISKCDCGHLESEHHEIGGWQCDKCSCNDSWFQSSEEKEIEKLQSELSANEQAYEKVSELLAERNRELAEARLEIERLNDIGHQTEIYANSMKNEKDNLKAENAKLKDENERLKSVLPKLEMESTERTLTVAKLEGEVEASKIHGKQIKSLFAEILKEIECETDEITIDKKGNRYELVKKSTVREVFKTKLKEAGIELEASND